MIMLVDQDARQGVGIQVDAPAARGVGAHEDVGHHRRRHLGAELRARPRIQRLQLGDHVGQVFVVDTAQLAQGRQVAARQEFEIVDQRRHGRVEAVALDQLQLEAFGHRLGHDAGGLEALTGGQHLFDQGDIAAQAFGDFTERHAHITGIVDPIDQDLGDRHFRRGEVGDQCLVGQVFVQRLFARQRPFHGVFVAIEATAALAGLRPVDHRTFAGIGRRGRFAFTHGRVVVTIDVRRRRIEVAIGRRGVAVAQFQFAGFVGFAVAGGRLAVGGLVRRTFAVLALQQRVAFQFGLDDGFQLKVRQLQQLDSLLQLGRDNQPLSLPEFQPLSERHAIRKSLNENPESLRNR